MSTELFVYGTLELAQLIEALIGRRPPSAVATLPGYRRGMLEGRRYPGIVPAQGEQVRGSVISGLDGDAVARIDAFESDEYDRLEVTAVLPDRGGVEHRVFAYVVAPPFRDLVTVQPWDADRFARLHLAEYVAALQHA